MANAKTTHSQEKFNAEMTHKISIFFFITRHELWHRLFL